jgi:hypothetical protein
MLKLEDIEIDLGGIAYFGIQSPLLKAYNLAHFINQFFEIDLKKKTDFESYQNKKQTAFPCYTSISEVDQCSYYLIGNKNGDNRLFSNYSKEDFWLLVQFDNGLNDHRFVLLIDKLYKALAEVEGVFSVIQVEPEKLTKKPKDFEIFKFDFSEYTMKLL